MTKKQSSQALVPPDFVLERYLAELPREMVAPLRLLFALRGAVQRVNGDLTQWLGPAALSPGRMQLLMVLWARKGAVPQSELVTALGVSRASVSELLATIAREKLVCARPASDHRRRLLIELTAEGREAADRLIRENAEHLAKSFAGLQQLEQSDLIGLLERVCRDGARAADD